MRLSSRERWILMGAGAALLIYVADTYALGPLIENRDRIDNETADCLLQLDRAASLFNRQRHLKRRWSEVTRNSMKAEPSAAESQLLHALRDWAQDAGLTLSSVKPEQTEEEKLFRKITFRAVGSGSMRAVSKFLWRIETCTIPARILDLQVAARKEGTDDLSIQLGVSTLALIAAPAAPPATAPAPSPAPERVARPKEGVQ
jgi:hypothetical protein